MKQLLVMGSLVFVSQVSRVASANPPAWCGSDKFDGNSETLRSLNSSKEIRDVMVHLAVAACTDTPEMQSHRAEIDAARAAWGKKLGMSEADWADVHEFDEARLGNYYKGDVSTKDLATLTPVDQYTAIYMGFGDGYSKLAGPFYAADALEQHLTETGRMALLDYCLGDESVTSADGSMSKWAICWPDFEKFDANKIYAEISGDKVHKGSSKMWLRFHAHDMGSMIKKMTEEKAKFIKKDEVWQKVFDTALKARNEWAKTVGSNTSLLELAAAMDAAVFFHSRKLLEGCEAKTEDALAAAIATIPAKSFAGWHDDREMMKPSFAQNAGPLLVNTPIVNVAAAAYAECHGKTPTGDYLSNYLQNVAGARGPRLSALAVVMGETFVFDDTNAGKMVYPSFGAKPYGRSGGSISSAGGVVKSVKKDGDHLMVALEKTSVKQDDCVQEHRANRVSRIRPDGSLEYEMICDKWATVVHDTTWTDFKVNAKFEKILKPGVQFSSLNLDNKGADIIAIWPNKTAKQPSIVLGATVK